MNTRKSCLLSLILFAFVSSATFAVESVAKDPTSVNEQIYKLLEGMDIENLDEGMIYIDFMLNDKSEIIVLSTSNENLDLTLKSVLNYKTLKSSELDYYKKYTVPVRIVKE